jgi:hypothetical protein
MGGTVAKKLGDGLMALRAGQRHLTPEMLPMIVTVKSGMKLLD